jgi:hypothetical protein
LGIINLRSQNTALLLKHMDKFYNKRDIPWVTLIWNKYYLEGEVPHATKDKGSFWWKDLLKLCDIYRGISKCTVGDLMTVLFWSDIWNDLLLQDKFPRLFICKKINQYQWQSFSAQPSLVIFFIFLYLMRHGKSTKLSKASYKGSRSQKEIKITVNTSEGTQNILHQNFTTYITTIFNHQGLSSGFGILNIQIK